MAVPHLMRLASDARLVGLIREGRRGAFEVAYDRHHLGILSFCRHMLADSQEAEDAVQDTFLAAYSDLISSDKPIQLKAWLFAIARNRCYSVLRARRERPAENLADTATEGLAAQVQRRQDLRDLVLDMRRLPKAQRAALVLAELDALSHEEIGVALGVPTEKVKALIFQARESLLASRTARETDCSVIRAQLANLRGGALRRRNLRRHLRECSGCRDFRLQVERQRRELAVLLPVAPVFALKESVITAALTGGPGAGMGLAGGAGLLAGTALKSGLTKGVIGIAAAVVGAGTIAAAGDLGLSWSSSPGLPLTHRLPAADANSARTGSGPASAGQRSIAGHRTAIRFGSTPTAWHLTGWPTSGRGLSLPGAGAILTYVGPGGRAPFSGGSRQRGIGISRLAAGPGQSGSGQATSAPLAPVTLAPGGAAGPTGAPSSTPTSAAVGTAAPAATSVPPDSGSRPGAVRVGLDEGSLGPGSGGRVGDAPSRQTGGSHGSGAATGGEGSDSSGSQPAGGGHEPNAPVSGPSAPGASGGSGGASDGSGTDAGEAGNGSGSHAGGSRRRSTEVVGSG